MSTEVLTINQAGHLADLLRAVEGNKRMRYYPNGADGDAVFTTVSLRAFTYDGGGLYRHDADIRDAFVWTSGLFERWFPVRDLMAALSNLDGHLGLDKPIAIIEDMEV